MSFKESMAKDCGLMSLKEGYCRLGWSLVGCWLGVVWLSLASHHAIATRDAEAPIHG